MFVEPVSLNPIPIMGITIDALSGDVLPIGGMTLDEPSTPILLYNNFTDKLTNKELKVTSVHLSDPYNWEVEQLNGGERALLDVNELYYESKVLDVLQDLNNALTGTNKSSGRHEDSILETLLKDLKKSRVRVRTLILRDGHDLVRRTERASILTETGGSPGMYEFVSTGQLLPILIGTEMNDPSGSGINVPILGIEKNKENGSWFPLGGTVEDVLGDGLKPIMLGDQVLDASTGKHSHCVGVKYNNEIGLTEPITANTLKKKKSNVPAVSVQLLEEEIAARKSFWRRQRKREEELKVLEAKIIQQLTKNEPKTSSLFQEQLDSIIEGLLHTNIFFFFM